VSSKKEIRRKRREQELEQKERGGRNPAVLFALGIAAAILITLGVFAAFADRGPGEPPSRLPVSARSSS
jgi:hypothetical protein